MRRCTAVVLSLIGVPIVGARGQNADWPTWGGDAASSKYSSLTEITPGNVTRLEIAWRWKSGETPIPASRRAFADAAVIPGKFQGTPLAVGDTLYIATSYTAVVALEGSTGRELWRYDPKVYEWGPQPRGCRFCHRGVAMWTDGTERRIFINTRWKLIALDARTGRPIPTFGDHGEVDLTADLAWEVNKLHYTNTSPPVVYEDIVITGSGMPDSRVYRGAPPGDIQAFDVRTGERVWTFHTIPQAGEFGSATWEDSSWAWTGGTNVWGPFTVDTALGLAYFPVGTPNGDFHGGHRLGDNLFAESILCLNAATGERVWHFQTVHHGIWDYDLPAPPNLVRITVDGRVIDAVAVVAKTGFTYVFDRVTGQPVWPIEERPVPASDVPGERTAPTQPFPTKPPPFARQGFTEDDVIDFTPELRAEALQVIRRFRIGGLFTPPSLDGTLLFPGVWGGANWGGAAVNPRTGMLYVRSTDWPQVFKLTAADPETQQTPYVISFERLEVDGLPIHKPPYTTLTGIDLNRGEITWQVPVGDAPSVRGHSRLRGLDPPALGKGPPEHGASGPLLTASGLIFVSGGAGALYAFDEQSGALLWEGHLEGTRGYANPMTFRAADGRQLIVIGTSRPDGSDGGLVAFGITP